VCERRVDKTTRRTPPRRLDPTDCISQLSFKFEKRVVAKFDAEHASSDGGAL